jgi:hypothetical protein
MKIIVCLKQVPKNDSILRLNEAETWIQERDLTYEINESDAYALEAALQLKEKHGGEVVALSLGPTRVHAAQIVACIWKTQPSMVWMLLAQPRRLRRRPKWTALICCSPACNRTITVTRKPA